MSNIPQNKNNNNNNRNQPAATPTPSVETKVEETKATETTSPSEDKVVVDEVKVVDPVTSPAPAAINAAAPVAQVTQTNAIKTSPQEVQVQKFAQAAQPVRKVNVPSMPVVRTKEAVSGLKNPDPLSTTPIKDVVARTGDENLAQFYEKLQRLDAKMGPGIASTPEQAGDLMGDVYRVIVNMVERPSTDIDFANHWNLLMRMITETPDGGFQADRLFRGKPFWSLGHEKFTHFEAVWNLLDASVRYREQYGRFVNEKKVMAGFSGGAQGRLGIFYRSFRG